MYYIYYLKKELYHANVSSHVISDTEKHWGWFINFIKLAGKCMKLLNITFPHL